MNTDLHYVTDLELPVDVSVLSTCRDVLENPGHLFGRREPVHHRHGVIPLHGWDVQRVRFHGEYDRLMKALHLDRGDQFVVRVASEMWSEGLDVGHDVIVLTKRVECSAHVGLRSLVGHGYDGQRIDLWVELAAEVG